MSVSTGREEAHSLAFGLCAETPLVCVYVDTIEGRPAVQNCTREAICARSISVGMADVWRKNLRASPFAIVAHANLEGPNGMGRLSHRYLGSLQLLASEKTAGSRSFPQSFFPARRGWSRKCAFRSAKYRSIAVLASSTDL
jgi:hypothetical protein